MDPYRVVWISETGNRFASSCEYRSTPECSVETTRLSGSFPNLMLNPSGQRV